MNLLVLGFHRSTVEGSRECPKRKEERKKRTHELVGPRVPPLHGGGQQGVAEAEGGRDEGCRHGGIGGGGVAVPVALGCIIIICFFIIIIFYY